MNDQRSFWNERFKKEGFMYGEKPNAFIAKELYRIKKGGSVLCLAEGEGRNALYLALNGFKTEALDASDVGLEKLSKRALEKQLTIKTHCLFLEDWDEYYHDESFDGIVASFMHLPTDLRLPTFKKALRLLNKGGHLIMEFFSKDQLLQGYTSGGPKDLNLLYDVTEFSAYFDNEDIEVVKLDQEVDVLDEGWGHQGEASLIRLILKKR